jgi:xanthine dehydrogenase YagR molybdenum-binding subunit
MPIQHINTLRGEGDDEDVRFIETNTLVPWRQDTPLTLIGRGIPRLDGEAKVTGRACYAYDVRLPGQLYACVLRSPHAHACIRRLNSSRAEALPGVHAVLSSANAPPIPWYDNSFLFDPTLRFVGDEVAAVAAESEDIARDALRLIEVEYEPQPFVVTMEAALQTDAPRVHAQGNIAGAPKIYTRGDVETGFSEAEVLIDEVYTTQTALHNCLEPHGCTAFWEGAHLTLWESTQSIWEVREQVAEKLQLPAHHVRVIKQYMGGGFGSKQIVWKPTVIAALLSRQARRPVQLMLDRTAENLAAGNRNATRQRVRLGARRDGTLTALSADIKVAVGAYMAGGEGSNVSAIYQRLYQCPHVRTEQVGIYINAGPSIAFRAPGHVEGAFALESAMDELARALHMDPLELRRRNYANTDQKKGQPYTTPNSLRLCYEQATAAFGWHTYRRASLSGPKYRGIGMAAHDWSGAGFPPGYAWVKLNNDGTADVVTATQDIGTGTRTGLLQVAAEELGLPMSHVALHLGDTAHGPYAPVSAGSATQATIGPAVRVAAAEVKQQLLKVAATVLEEKPERLQVHNGMIHVEGKPAPAVSVEDMTQRIAPHMIQGWGGRQANPTDKSVRTFGAQCVEVEVDIDTGEVTILRIVAAHDCGRIINATMVDSQVIGGITQGIGFALTEERVMDVARGTVLNANLEEYKVPTVADIPPILHAQVNLPDPEANLTGAKGIGEPPLVPTAPAIANAIFDAIGVRLRHTPFSCHRLLTALAARQAPQSQPEDGESA